jgi:hypothetical protein
MRYLLALLFVIQIQIFYAQTEQNTVVVAATLSEFENNLSQNSLSITFPSSADVVKITSTADFYTDYFTVQYNETTRVAKLHYLNNENISRLVTVRFLFSNNINFVSFNGNTFENTTFFEQYLK